MVEELDKLGNVSLGMIWSNRDAIKRHVLTVTALLTFLYGMSAKIIRPYAEEAIINVMKQAGVNPKTFKDVVAKVDDMSKDTDIIKKDLSSVKLQNVEQLIGQRDLANQLNHTDKLVQQLLKAVLERNQKVNIDLEPQQ